MASMQENSDPTTAAPRFSPWRWLAWGAAILAGILVASAALDRYRMEKLRAEVESRGGRLEGQLIYPGWYKWLLAKAPQGWARQTVLKLSGNFRRIVTVNVPPGSALPPHFISRLTRFQSLVNLRLPGCHLTDSDLDGLSKFSELRILVLRDNPVSDRGFTRWDKLQSLTIIDFKGTRIGDEFMGHVARLPKLAYLDLTNSSVTDAGLRAIGSHPLRTLFLSGTQVSDSGLNELAPLPHLSQLTLDNCPITDTGLAAIDDHRFPLLVSLTISGTQVTAEGVSRLRLGHLQRYSFPAVAMTDEDWRELAGLKKLDYVTWGDVELRRCEVFPVGGRGRRTRLDAFRTQTSIRDGRRVRVISEIFPKPAVVRPDEF